MCARLIRLFNENYGKKRAIHSATPKGKHDFFPDDEDFAEEFLEQRWIIDISTDDSVLNSHENNAMANPHTPWAPELIKALVHAEQFMRSSVSSLELLRSVEPDTRIFNRPSDPALDWVRHALDMAMRIQQLFIENEILRNSIMEPGLHPPPALAKFLELIFLILSTYHLWDGRRDNHWIWPDIQTSDYNQDWHNHFPYVDLVRELEEIQQLLDKQNSARDRLRNANFATSCNLVNEAFAISSKVLAIRIDLGYARGTSSCLIGNISNHQDKPIFNIDKFLSHLSIFLGVMNKSYGNSRLAYILKIEYGISKGYHAHILLLLNGQKHQKDISIAHKLGKSWAKDITQGLGVYWNCNANKLRYRKDAIGMINRTDEQKKEYLKKYVLTYLVKHDIPLEMLREKTFRKFRASHRRLK
jgi:Inovirus Gp2